MFYKLFNFPRPATTAAFDKQAFAKHYRKLTLLIHPDKCQLPGATQVTQILTAAYRIMTDDGLREAFDYYGWKGIYDEDVGITLKEINQATKFLRKHFPSGEPESEDELIVIDDDDEDSGHDSPDAPSSTTNTSQPDPSPAPPEEADMTEEAPDNSSFNQSYATDRSFREVVIEVTKHSTRYGETKFYTHWGPHDIWMWERLDALLEEKHGLAAYLKKLKKEKPRSFIALVKKFPHIVQVL